MQGLFWAFLRGRKLRLPSFVPNRALGDIGILSSISKGEMCQIIIVLLVRQLAGGNHPPRVRNGAICAAKVYAG
jgi:hypothetical protein